MPRWLSTLLLAAAVATVPACSDDPQHYPANATLADSPVDLSIVIGTGGDGVARLYLRIKSWAPCPILDDTFGFSVDGVEGADPFPGAPDDPFCDEPGGSVDLVDGAGPAVIRMYDASKEIVARLEPRLVEPRRLTLTSHASWREVGAGDAVTVTASHPDDFARPVLDAYIHAGRPSVSLDILPVVDGERVTFTMPANIDDFDGGEVRIRFSPTELAAASCEGARACTFDWSPATYLLAFER